MLRNRMRSLVFGMLCTAVSLNASSLEPASTIYRVQVGEQDLLMLQDQLQAQGWGPLSFEQSAGGVRLLLGEAEYYVDALLCARHFENSYGIPSQVVAIDNTEGELDLAGIGGPMPTRFQCRENHMSEVPDSALPEADPLVEQLESLQQSNDTAAYRLALMNAIHTLPDADVRKGYAITRKGILELLERNFDDALLWLGRVANGEVAARRLDRNKCMRRVGWILHQQGKRLEAYQAYRELERFTENELVRAMVRVECAGLLMELARHEGIGSLAECRRECQKMLEVTDEQYRQERATAELMFLETFYYEGRNEIAASLADSFVMKYPDRPRELSMALLFQACAHKGLGNYEQSKAALLKVLTTEWPEDPGESWGSSGHRWDMKRKAADFLKKYATQFEDADGVAVAEGYLNR